MITQTLLKTRRYLLYVNYISQHNAHITHLKTNCLKKEEKNWAICFT